MNQAAVDFYVTRKQVVRSLRKQLDYFLKDHKSAVMVASDPFMMPWLVPMEKFSIYLAKHEVMGVLDRYATDEDISAMVFGG